MTIAVTNIGTNGAIALSLSASVGVGGVPSGSLIVVCVQDTTSGAATGSVADTAGNTYTLIASKSPNNSSTNGAAQMFYAWNSTALTSGNTITYTGTNAGTSKSISALYATGIQTSSSPLDTAVTVTGSSAVASPSALVSGTPAVAGELFVACLGRNNPTGAVFSQDTTHGWATPPNAASEGSGSPHSGINGGSQVNAGTSTISWQPTFNTGANSGSVVAGFKPSAGGNTLAIASTEGADTASVTLHLTDRVSAALTESADVLAATIHLTDRLSAGLVEGADTLAATIHVTDRLAIAVTEGADVLAANLKHAGGIVAALQEGPDVAALTLHLTDRVSLALIESADIAAVRFRQTQRMSAALVESGDIFVATLTSGSGKSVHFGIIESPDCALMTFYPLYVESVPFFDGAGFSDGARFRQVRRRQFITTPSEGDEWTNLNPTGDPWTQVPDASDSWNPVN